MPLKDRLAHYRTLCATYAALPAPRETVVDHGRKRFLRFDLPAAAGRGCATPPLAWIDEPAAGATLAAGGEVRGWALQEGGGVERVDVTLDGRVVASAAVDRPMPGVAGYWRLQGRADAPLGFSVRVPAGLPAGDAWLGLVLHRRDGGIARWPEQRVTIVASGQDETRPAQGR